MTEFKPINMFPNFIFIPKIVPLVYDDALSYYEFLNKVLVKLNEMIQNVNDLGLDVEELKSAVEQLSTLIDGFDGRIEFLETEFRRINSLVDNLNIQMSATLVDVENLRLADAALSARIESIENQITTDIAAAVAQLQTEIGEVSADVGAMQSQVSSNSERITALEAAEFEAPVVADYNFLQANDIQHLDNFDYEIRRLDGSDETPDAIQIVSGYIRFFTDSTYNPCALIIKNALTYTPGLWSASNIVSFGLKYRLTGSYSSQNGTDYSVDIPFTSLTGSSPYIANDTTKYTDSRGTLRVLAFKTSADGKSYDLWIYNNYNYQYRSGNIVDIYAIAGVFKSFAGWTMANKKAYWAQVYGATGNQIGGLIKKYAPGIVSQATSSSNLFTTAQVEAARTDLESFAYTQAEGVNEFLQDNHNYYVDDVTIGRTDGSEVSFNAISPLNSDITVDYSNTKFGVNHFTGNYFAYENWLEEIRLYINIEVTITGSGAVNTPDSIPVMNITNTLGATIPSLIPLTAVAALPGKAPFTEAYLHPNGNIIFRCWFDDTNYDYTNNPVKVRIAGFIPLPYEATSPNP